MKKSDLNSLDFSVNRFFKNEVASDRRYQLNLADHISLLTCPVAQCAS